MPQVAGAEPDDDETSTRILDAAFELFGQIGIPRTTMEDVARPRGVSILSGSVDEDPARERALIGTFVGRQVDGLVVAPASDNQAYLTTEVLAGTPVVFVDRPPIGFRADAVLIDNRAGARQAVEHLIAGGHRAIGYVQRARAAGM